ncbi:isochorismate synthase [Ewingella americana]|uniref:isochorismate synthase n=1 Tax=Ewingella americana TaxID=41202 RepID=A0A502GQG8_9GAMM|nr:isochorismate synthase [Ewingella americana]TPG63163.1 isochorismate synthase [Ewingella americana]
MDTLVSGAGQTDKQVKNRVENVAEISPTNGFFFTSPFRSLATQGCFTRLTLPAAGGEVLSGQFQQAVQQAFSQARDAGIAHPILCGAIPFDAQQPSALFVPKDVKWFDRQAFLDNAQLAQGELPEITRKAEHPAQPEFMQMVSSAVEATSRGALRKVVLSRLLEIETCQPVDNAALMARMIEQNPHGFHFHVPLKEGALLGASPELLLRKLGNHFHSNPLAGSARRSSDQVQDDAAKSALRVSAKDAYEHHIVTDGMREVLAPRCSHLHIPSQPELLSTPTLWHLASPIDGDVADSAENALSLACLLHPTPALCGSPTASARDLIAQLEPFDRGLFGGIVGWCDAEGNGEWVVTIRCGTVKANHVTLFAGAGIVPDSSPESEWAETGTKLSTMMLAFGLK